MGTSDRRQRRAAHAPSPAVVGVVPAAPSVARALLSEGERETADVDAAPPAAERGDAAEHRDRREMQ